MFCIIKPPLAIAKAALRGGAVYLFVCLFVYRRNAYKKTRFSQKLYLELWSLLMTNKKTWAFQRNHYWTPKIQDGGSPPSWILMPKCKKAIFSKIKQSRAVLSIDDLSEVVYGLFKEPIIGPLKSDMAKIRHLRS